MNTNPETETPLACPHCGNTRLWSDEAASIMYPVELSRNDEGAVVVDYPGDGYEVMDEGTEYVADIWCRGGCGAQLTEGELVPQEEG